MCGICGAVTSKLNKNLDSLLKSMLEAMKWRGPDRSDTYSLSINEKNIGLGHCRLSVLDLSDNGNQPMISNDENAVIVYNGEVYNFDNIRLELKKRGYLFHSECDTEVILYACKEWGVYDAVCKFNGMFAFCFFDKTNNKLYLVRDRLGVKPLYYYEKNNDLYFASDLRAFTKSSLNFDKSIDKNALYGYLWNMYIPSPSTIFKDVYKLDAGVILEYDLASGTKILKKYWNINDFHPNKKLIHETEVMDELENIIRRATKRRLISDVPVGVFLSGGIDSSLVTVLASQVSENSLNTYSMGFKEKTNDDLKYASDIAKILGTHHEYVYCTEKDAIDIFPDIAKAYSEPFADNSQIATMLLSKLVKKDVTVGITGDGGDEFFCGYPTFLMQKRMYSLRGCSSIINLLVRPFIDSKKNILDYHRWIVDKVSNISDLESIINLDYFTARGILDSILDIESEFENKYWTDSLVSEIKKENIIDTSMKHSIIYGLKDMMLVKVDRASMYYSLECRSPLLDKEVVEYALQMPVNLKNKNGILKYPLKKILGQYIPKQIIDRPKMGFGIPVNEWLHGKLKTMVQDFLNNDYIGRQNIFNKKGVESLLKMFYDKRNPIVDRIVYTLLMFQLWYEEYFV